MSVRTEEAISEPHIRFNQEGGQNHLDMKKSLNPNVMIFGAPFMLPLLPRSCRPQCHSGPQRVIQWQRAKYQKRNYRLNMRQKKKERKAKTFESSVSSLSQVSSY